MKLKKLLITVIGCFLVIGVGCSQQTPQTLEEVTSENVTEEQLALLTFALEEYTFILDQLESLSHREEITKEDFHEELKNLEKAIQTFQTELNEKVQTANEASFPVIEEVMTLAKERSLPFLTLFDQLLSLEADREIEEVAADIYNGLIKLMDIYEQFTDEVYDFQLTKDTLEAILINLEEKIMNLNLPEEEELEEEELEEGEEEVVETPPTSTEEPTVSAPPASNTPPKETSPFGEIMTDPFHISQEFLDLVPEHNLRYFKEGRVEIARENLTDERLIQFFNQNLKGSDFFIFTIDFMDGTGYVFWDLENNTGDFQHMTHESVIFQFDGPGPQPISVGTIVGNRVELQPTFVLLDFDYLNELRQWASEKDINVVTLDVDFNEIIVEEEAGQVPYYFRGMRPHWVARGGTISVNMELPTFD